MRILAIDTSTLVGAVGFLNTETSALAEVNIRIGRTHSQRLLGCIDFLLGAVECPLPQIDVLGVSVGPGSFTGLRIGMSIMQGLAFAEGKTLLPLSSLQALALNCAGFSHLICPMIDARRNEVFTALYRFDGMELIEESPERACSPARIIKSASAEKTIFLGDGASAYRHVIEAEMKSEFVIAPDELCRHRGANLVRLAAERSKTVRPVDPGEIQPRYLRKSDADQPSEKRQERAE